MTLRDGAYGEFLYEGIVHVDEAQPSYPATRRPAFETVARYATQVARDRAGAGAQPPACAHGARLRAPRARTPRRPGRPLAAALQQGAAEGHAQLAVALAHSAPAASPAPGALDRDAHAPRAGGTSDWDGGS